MYIRYLTANACLSKVFQVIVRSSICTLSRDVYLLEAFHFFSKPYISERDVRFFSLGGTVRDRNSGNLGFLHVINFTYCHTQQGCLRLRELRDVTNYVIISINQIPFHSIRINSSRLLETQFKQYN